jgi:hypothetical protein
MGFIRWHVLCSNVGANFSLIGSLAAVMWVKLLKVPCYCCPFCLASVLYMHTSLQFVGSRVLQRACCGEMLTQVMACAVQGAGNAIHALPEAGAHHDAAAAAAEPAGLLGREPCLELAGCEVNKGVAVQQSMQWAAIGKEPSPCKLSSGMACSAGMQQNTWSDCVFQVCVLGSGAGAERRVHSFSGDFAYKVCPAFRHFVVYNIATGMHCASKLDLLFNCGSDCRCQHRVLTESLEAHLRNVPGTINKSLIRTSPL